MAYEQKDNSGALFKNDRKDSDKHPDYTGNCMVNGRTMRLAAWIKDGKNGKFMSIKFSEPQERDAPRQGGTAMMADDDIPFAPERRG